MSLKFLRTRLKQSKLSMIQIETQLKFLHYHLKKYEYLTEKDLGYKLRVSEEAKCEYSPFGKVFNKGLDEKDKRAFEKVK